MNIVMGSFNAESYWRDENLAKLPAIRDREAAQIISSMDELLFPLCGKNDVLITRHKMDQSFRQYLNQIGFSFQSNELSLENPRNALSQDEENVFKLIVDTDRPDYYSQLIEKHSVLEPYAVLPHLQEFCSRYGVTFQGPDFDIVMNVNSKIYSYLLHGRLGLKSYGRMVENSKDMSRIGLQYLEPCGFLIKDPFGVSGKGNIYVNTQRILERIVKFIEAQERSGKYTRFIVEPFYDKKMDFSCQIQISQKGVVSILSVQQMENNGFAYSGSKKAKSDLLAILDKNSYFDIMVQAAGELHRDGYYGNICVDSMLLNNNEIIPILEINARKSMGYLNHLMDRFLNNYDTSGEMSYLPVCYQKIHSFESILSHLDDNGLLFNPKKGQGIIPLSSKAMTVNGEMDMNPEADKFYKGRLYFSIAGADNEEEKKEGIQKLKNTLSQLNINVVG